MRTLKIAAGCLLLVVSYAALLCFPEPLFPFAVQASSLTLYSDRQFSEPAAKLLLERVEARLSTSPLYSASRHHDIFLCNSRWRQMLLLFGKDYGVAGVSLYPVTSNVFLREAKVEDNRLISPGGTPVPGDRTLDYFIAHEVTHELTGHALGPVRFLRLPQWVREGYADYVGKGGSFDYDESRRAFLAGEPEMDWKKSGLYRRYHLLVAYLLERRGWSVSRLLEDPPSQVEVEAAVID